MVTKADALDPVLNVAFVEYAQSRGFLIDPARVRSPQDKGRVERAVQFAQTSFWAGEDFGCLAEAQ
ncbi:MAG: IS21 family transposase, partial [Acidimicrobiia bacterium]|nr:IS21 family transposase [Acidimicrobiia bacterium]